MAMPNSFSPIIWGTERGRRQMMAPPPRQAQRPHPHPQPQKRNRNPVNNCEGGRHHAEWQGDRVQGPLHAQTVRGGLLRLGVEDLAGRERLLPDHPGRAPAGQNRVLFAHRVSSAAGWLAACRLIESTNPTLRYRCLLK